MFTATSILLILSLISSTVALQCDCGFKDPLDPTSALYTNYFEFNFTTTSRDQLCQVFRLLQGDMKKNGTTRRFRTNNVAIDERGLHLTVSASLPGLGVPSAEVFTKDTNFGFGSYHWLAQTTAVPGTVQGFYMYKSDDNEVDMEYISKPSNQMQTLLYSVKPQLYTPDGIALSSTLVPYTPPFDISAGFHTYSFVWNPTSIIYSIDHTNWTQPIMTNVPSQPGVLAMSHWSDGDPKFSGGPPMDDSTLTINRVWVFYNSTQQETTLPCQNSKQPCTVGEMEPIVANGTNICNSSTKIGTTRIGFGLDLFIPVTLIIAFALL